MTSAKVASTKAASRDAMPLRKMAEARFRRAGQCARCPTYQIERNGGLRKASEKEPTSILCTLPATPRILNPVERLAPSQNPSTVEKNLDFIIMAPTRRSARRGTPPQARSPLPKRSKKKKNEPLVEESPAKAHGRRTRSNARADTDTELDKDNGNKGQRPRAAPKLKRKRALEPEDSTLRPASPAPIMKIFIHLSRYTHLAGGLSSNTPPLPFSRLPMWTAGMRLDRGTYVLALLGQDNTGEEYEMLDDPNAEEDQLDEAEVDDGISELLAKAESLVASYSRSHSASRRHTSWAAALHQSSRFIMPPSSPIRSTSPSASRAGDNVPDDDSRDVDSDEDSDDGSDHQATAERNAQGDNREEDEPPLESEDSGADDDYGDTVNAKKHAAVHQKALREKRVQMEKDKRGGKNGKGKEKEKESGDNDEDSGKTHCSGPLSAATKEAADALAQAFHSGIEDLARESGKSAQTIHRSLGTLLQPQRRPSAWNVFQRWYNHPDGCDAKKPDDMSKVEWGRQTAEQYKTKFLSGLDGEATSDRVFAHMPWLHAWVDEQRDAAIKYRIDQGAFGGDINKVATMVTKLLTLANAELGVHRFGFLVDTKDSKSCAFTGSDVVTELGKQGGLYTKKILKEYENKIGFMESQMCQRGKSSGVSAPPPSVGGDSATEDGGDSPVSGSWVWLSFEKKFRRDVARSFVKDSLVVDQVQILLRRGDITEKDAHTYHMHWTWADHAWANQFRIVGWLDMMTGAGQYPQKNFTQTTFSTEQLRLILPPMEKVLGCPELLQNAKVDTSKRLRVVEWTEEEKNLPLPEQYDVPLVTTVNGSVLLKVAGSRKYVIASGYKPPVSTGPTPPRIAPGVPGWSKAVRAPAARDNAQGDGVRGDRPSVQDYNNYGSNHHIDKGDARLQRAPSLDYHDARLQLFPRLHSPDDSCAPSRHYQDADDYYPNFQYNGHYEDAGHAGDYYLDPVVSHPRSPGFTQYQGHDTYFDAMGQARTYLPTRPRPTPSREDRHLPPPVPMRSRPPVSTHLRPTAPPPWNDCASYSDSPPPPKKLQTAGPEHGGRSGPPLASGSALPHPEEQRQLKRSTRDMLAEDERACDQRLCQFRLARLGMEEMVSPILRGKLVDIPQDQRSRADQNTWLLDKNFDEWKRLTSGSARFEAEEQGMYDKWVQRLGLY
ncbi:hypothetical protein DFH09DRAFT_1299890 [Mycena vulgaris]|nr:hypothetical protein DFH09DRAFT_1299890 [Mycena vulgaris]